MRKGVYPTFMRISIEYCQMWNYLPEATRVAAEIKDTLGVDVELIAGSGGVFIVRDGEKNVYNKQDSGVFPVEGTIIDLLKR